MIRLRTLGALDLRDSEGQELRGVLAQPKRIALLAYLTLATPRGPQRRDTLVALFWPDHDEERARNALNQAVHFLRRSLGPDALVNRNGDELGLDRGQLWCDAVAFEEALDAGRLNEAMDLYRGELLEGLHVVAAPEFEQWLERERARLGGRYVQAVEALAVERESVGDVNGAVTLWRRLVARDLYNSRFSLRLMRAMAAAGDPAGAVQHARLHETLLREELDVAPDPQIVAFVRQLQSEAPVGPPSAGTPDRMPSAATVPQTSPPMTPTASRPRSGRHHRAAVMAFGIVMIVVAGAGAVVLKNGTRDAPLPPIPRIAVLPLESFSGDSTQQAFADGMHDALITELARHPGLRVISRTSVMQYKGQQKALPEIARELNVDALIEGTLLWEGGRVRMNAQLVHGPSDRHLWAKSYTRDLREVLALQAELAEAIARELHVASGPTQRPVHITSAAADSIPLELHLRELYLRGRHAAISRSLAGLQTAKEYYRLAIDRDSSFALAYAGLADTYGHLGDYSFAPLRPSLDSARMMAQRAVALDSNLAEARTALGVTLADAHQFAAAERQFLKAIELSPSNALAHFRYSVLLVGLGRGHEALREAERALELDPAAPRGLFGMIRYARWLISGERAEMRLSAEQRRLPVLKVEPGEPWARAAYAITLSEEGRCGEAHAEIVRAQQLAPDNLRMLPQVAAVYWWCGEKKRARALVRAAETRPDADDNGYRIAMAYAMFGEKDRAFAWLDRQWFTMGELSGLSADRKVDALRSDPRYAQLLQRLGVRQRSR